LWWVILISVLGGMVILMVIALSIPIEAAFCVDTSTNPQFQVKMSWLYGLVKWKLGLSQYRVGKENKKKRLVVSQRTLLKIVTTRGFMEKTVGLVWKTSSKSAALPKLTLYFYVASMALDYPIGHCESQTDSFHFIFS